MPQKKSENSTRTLREMLLEINHAKLVDIILSVHDKNLTVGKKIDLICASLNDDPQKVDYHGSDAVAECLNDLRLMIGNDLHAKSPNSAFALMLDLLDLHKHTLERVDDSKGIVSAVFAKACTDLGASAGHVTSCTAQELVEITFTRFMNNNYGIYDGIIYSFQDVLQDQDWHVLQDKLEHAVNDKNIVTIKAGLMAIADSTHDVDAYIAACAFKSGINAYNHLHIAQRLIKCSRPTAALQWLENMVIPSSTHYWQQEKQALKIQALEAAGDSAQDQQELWSWFFETLNPKLYGKILTTATPDVKETFQSAALNKAFTCSEPYIPINNHFAR